MSLADKMQNRPVVDGLVSEPTVQTTVRLPESLHRRLKVHAAVSDESMTQTIIRLLRRDLDKLDDML